MPAVFKNNTVKVIQHYDRVAHKGALAMAEDVIRESNPRTPYRKGGLRNKRRHEMVNKNTWKVIWPLPYAAAINAGYAGKHRVKSWTTPGTGKGFVEKGLNYVRKNYKRYFK